MRSKYANRKVEIDGRTFDSFKEGQRYLQLKLLASADQITDLQCQPVFRLDVNGQHVCKYIADFSYLENGQRVVEDVKSDFTRKLAVYRIKNKLLRAVHGVEIREV